MKKFFKFLIIPSTLFLILISFFGLYTYKFFNSPTVANDTFFVVEKGDNFFIYVALSIDTSLKQKRVVV